MLGLLLTSATVRAEVRDGAGFFSADAIRQADDIARQVRQRHGKDIVVETIPSLPGAPADAAAREKFFQDETSRRGKEAGTNGVYILISRNPSTLYAGIDPQTQKNAFTIEDRGRLREVLIQHFKAKDFDGGLVAGMRLIDDTMAVHASKPGGSASPGTAVPTNTNSGSAAGRSNTPANTASSGGIGKWLCLGIGVLIVFGIVRAFTRRGQMSQGYGAPTNYGGQPGYGAPGYPPQQGGGGFGRGVLGGLLGGVAGGYLYDQVRGHGGNEANAATPPPLDPNSTPLEAPDSTSGFGDFGDTSGSGGGGGNFGGGGGDFGGGDSGGGGGDF